MTALVIGIFFRGRSTTNLKMAANYSELIKLNVSRINLIAKIHKEVNGPDKEAMAFRTVECHLDCVEEFWEKIEINHEKLVAASADDEDLAAHDYFKKDSFSIGMGYYYEARGALQLLYETKKPAEPARPTVTETTTSSSRTRHLPDIPLPQFSGDYGDWIGFRDLFNSMVGSLKDLPKVEKLHHLRACLQGEAYEVIANLAVSDENYDTAWTRLTAQYEVNRFLVAAHLSQLQNPPAMATHSVAALKALLKPVKEAMTALTALGSPVDTWDQMISNILVERLSDQLSNLWEEELEDSTEYPDLNKLMTFLKVRIRTMEGIEKKKKMSRLVIASASAPATNARSQPSRFKSTAKTLTVTAPTVATSTPPTRPRVPPNRPQYPCSMCDSPEHYVASCPQFKGLSPAERIEVVASKRLCYNCLGRHNYRKCRTPENCNRDQCKEPHHTLLHDLPPASNPTSQSTSSNAAGNNGQSRQSANSA